MKYDVFTEIAVKLEELGEDKHYFDDIKKLKFLFNDIHFCVCSNEGKARITI